MFLAVVTFSNIGPKGREMEFKQLRYFSVVAELESFTAAADRLNVTQPAVGMQVRKLEESVGLKLMLRHSRGVRLTPAGRVMLDHARSILDMIAQTERALGKVRNEDSAEIRIGVTPSLSTVFVPRLLELCYEQYPELSLIFTQGLPSELVEEMRSGKLDFCFTNREIDKKNYESVPLYFEEIRLIGAIDEIGKLPDPVPFETLASLPIVLDGRDTQLASILQRELSKNDLYLEKVTEVRAIQIRRTYATKRARFCIAPSALFYSEILSGVCATRSLGIPDLLRCIQLGGPRVEAMTAAEGRVRELAITIIEQMVSEDVLGWTLPEHQ
mgnify:CR=1 FL=1